VSRRSFTSRNAASHLPSRGPTLGHAPGSAVTRKHYQRAYDDSKKQAVIDLDVPLSTMKKNGRWQSKPKIWQSMATPR
jgi:hypothetical protein